MDMIIALLCVSFVNVSPAFSDSKSSDDYVPCDRGWYYFRDKCYRVAGHRESERRSWDSALARCEKDGGDLASITSQEEQDFVFTFLLMSVRHWIWIGLHDSDEEGVYKWTDGSVYNYSNWWNGKINEDDCVYMMPKPIDEDLGTWDADDCDSKYAYICKKNSNPRKKSPNMMYCSPEDGGGYKYQTSCYHVVTEIKSWENAEKYCKYTYNGHLLTIRDIYADFFLDGAIPEMRKETWIGIKIQNQLQQKWVSQWYVSHERFKKDERYEEGTCVARKNRTEWITIPCSKELPFICEVSKATPPTLKQPPNGAHCPKELDDWRDFGGEYCYYIQNTEKVSHYDALLDCKRRGGELASLHSQEETDIIQPFLINGEIKWFFIGLIRLLAFNEEHFAWLDGSQIDYQNWGADQHMDVSDCVHIHKYNMKWYITNSPREEDFGYICSVKKIVPHSSLVKKEATCKSYCVSPYSYLDGLLSQCTDAKQIL